MKTITEQQLRDVLDKHEKWLRNEEGGERADLSYTDLSDANLVNGLFRSANLRLANLTGADLSGADLSGSDFSDVILSNAIFTGAHFGYDIPVIQDIHETVYEAASQEGALNMGAWHKCDTTHCRAGWVVHLAGDEGYELEKRLSTQIAAVAIYEASDPGFISREGVPNFHASNEDALHNMKKLSETTKEVSSYEQ